FTVQGIPAFPVTLNCGNGSDRLVGPDSTSLWQITSTGAGVLNGMLKFTGAENLTGGGLNDIFAFSAATGVTGMVDGGPGTNNMDYALYTTPVTVNLQTSTATGTGGYAGMAAIVGGKGQDKLIGPNQANTWNIAAANSGTVGGLTFFSF